MLGDLLGSIPSCLAFAIYAAAITHFCQKG